jgi:anti-sigma B factor antagonist
MGKLAQPPVGTRQNGALGYIDFPRDVTAQTRENAYAAYNHLAVQRVRAIGFNFSATDYLNSAGIGLIISLVEDATTAGRKVFAYGLNSHNRKLFRMVGLTERLTLVADEAEMHAKLAPPEQPTPTADQAAAQPSATATQEAAAVEQPAAQTAEATVSASAAQTAPASAVLEQPAAQAADEANPKAEV